MNIELILYLIDIGINFQIVTFIASIIMMVLYFITAFHNSTSFCDNEKISYKNHLFASKILTVFIFISILVPSKKTMYMMIGAKYLRESNVPEKVQMIINKKLDEYLLENKSK